MGLLKGARKTGWLLRAPAKLHLARRARSRAPQRRRAWTLDGAGRGGRSQRPVRGRDLAGGRAFPLALAGSRNSLPRRHRSNCRRAGAAATVVGLAVFFDVLEHYEEPGGEIRSGRPPW